MKNQLTQLCYQSIACKILIRIFEIGSQHPRQAIVKKLMEDTFYLLQDFLIESSLEQMNKANNFEASKYYKCCYQKCKYTHEQGLITISNIAEIQKALVKLLQRGNRQNSHNIEIQYILCEMYLKRKCFKKSVEIIGKFINQLQEPYYLLFRYIYARIQLRMDKQCGALALLSSRDSSTQSAQLLSNIQTLSGWAWYRRKGLKSAQSCFQKGMKYTINGSYNEYAYRSCIETLILESNFEDAQQIIYQYNKLFSSCKIEGLLVYLCFSINRQSYRNMYQEIKKLQIRYGQNSNIIRNSYKWIALANYQSFNYQEAYHYFAKSQPISQFQTFQPFYQYFADTCFKIKKYWECIKYLQIDHQSSPLVLLALFHAGERRETLQRIQQIAGYRFSHDFQNLAVIRIYGKLNIPQKAIQMCDYLLYHDQEDMNFYVMVEIKLLKIINLRRLGLISEAHTVYQEIYPRFMKKHRTVLLGSDTLAFFRQIQFLINYNNKNCKINKEKQLIQHRKQIIQKFNGYFGKNVRQFIAKTFSNYDQQTDFESILYI